MLSGYVTEHGYITQAACTCNPCHWNKGKEKANNPQKLHQAEYNSSSERQRSDELYKWDPRPEEFRGNVDVSAVSRCAVQLLAAASSTNRSTMWETLLKVSYEHFELSAEDVVYYKNLTEKFQQCFTENDIKTWEMQWNVARFQTQIIRESLRCSTSPRSVELQLRFVK